MSILTKFINYVKVALKLFNPINYVCKLCNFAFGNGRSNTAVRRIYLFILVDMMLKMYREICSYIRGLVLSLSYVQKKMDPTGKSSFRFQLFSKSVTIKSTSAVS
jgi:hypothetical protein